MNYNEKVFTAMTKEEMMAVDGGGLFGKLIGAVIGGVVAVVAVAATPVSAPIALGAALALSVGGVSLPFIGAFLGSLF